MGYLGFQIYTGFVFMKGLVDVMTNEDPGKLPSSHNRGGHFALFCLVVGVRPPVLAGSGALQYVLVFQL